MASSFTRKFLKNIGTSAVSLYNPTTASMQSTVIGLSVCNTSAASITIDVYITVSAVNYYLAFGLSLSPRQSFILAGADQKLVMLQNDNLYVKSSAATSADAYASVLEIS